MLMASRGREFTDRPLPGNLIDADLLPISFVGPRWFCVFTNIRCEARANNGLAEKGYRTFFPFVRKWVSHARTKQVVKRPLFSRYIFVEVDIEKQSIEEIRLTDGVESIVSAGNIPLTLPSDFMGELIYRQLSGEFDEVKDGPIPVGAKVAIVEGPYDGFFARLKSGKRKGEMLLQLLDDKRRGFLRVARHQVRAA